jgi:leucyl-tRNA synthetase
MDPNNSGEFCAREKSDYWGQVDLYMGGAEHATGHLLYSRFWCKVLFDHGLIGFDEPFKKMINQGMIGGVIEYLMMKKEKTDGVPHFMCRDTASKYGLENFIPIAVRTDLVKEYGNPDSYLTQDGLMEFSKWMPAYEDAIFECGQGVFQKGVFSSSGGESSWLLTKSEQGKMGKRYHNTVDPTTICDEYGADTLRCYEMFLGPIEQHKPWDTNGISGVYNFLRKLSRLFAEPSSDEPSKASLKTIHQTIKKVTEDIERFSFNTVVSGLMICVNELGQQKCASRSVLEPLVVLLSPYAPHLAEELWEKLGMEGSVTKADWPVFDPSMLEDDAHNYPVSFNGKMRFKMEFPITATPKEIEEAVLAAEASAKYLEGKTPKKVIVVPKKIVNVVL